VGRRAALLLWLVVGGAIWNGVFDLYVSRGAREYLQREAEFELHRGPNPVMADVMAHARRDGALAASIWALVVTTTGVATIFLVKK
jgi:hypothetical protein